MKKTCLTLIFSLLAIATAGAQGRSCHLWFNDVPLVADTTAHKMYVTLEPKAPDHLTGSLRWSEEVYQKVELDGTELPAAARNFSVDDWSAASPHTLALTSANGREEWQMVFSTLPFVLIEADQGKLFNFRKQHGSNAKTTSYFQVIDARCRTRLKDGDAQGLADFGAPCGIRVRGATAAGHEKKPFAIELHDAEGEDYDVHLLGYRKDADWILDAVFTDPSKMRNRVITDIWTAIDPLPYATDNGHQMNGTEGEFVEVFMEGKYWGIYCLTDKVDRKKLNLKKTKEASGTDPEVLRGLLWKATFATGATWLSSYKEVPTNDTLVWEEYWEQKYPDDRQDQGFFTPISNAIDVITKSNGDSNFKANIGRFFYEENLIDYILLLQAFELMDNQQKNYYLSSRNYSKGDERLLFTLWDLDASLGRSAGGDECIHPEWNAFGEKMKWNYLVWRMCKVSPNDFQKKLARRWAYLKAHDLSLENIRKRFQAYGQLLTRSGAWQREYELATVLRKGKEVKQAVNVEDEIDYIIDFLDQNYASFEEQLKKWGVNFDPEPDKTEDYSALYVVGPDVVSTHEDNTTTMPGLVTREPVDGIGSVSFSEQDMTVNREGSASVYALKDVKEVLTSGEGLYPTPAFVPERFKSAMDFNTHFATPGAGTPAATDDGFTVERSLTIVFEDDRAVVVGNAGGFEIASDGARITITSDMEGVEYILKGQAADGHLTLNNAKPAKINVGRGEVAQLAGIEAKGDLLVNPEGTLHLVYDQPCDEAVNNNYALLKSEGDILFKGGNVCAFNTAYNGKDVQAAGTVSVEGGAIYLMTVGSGTVTDDNFKTDASLGVRAVLGKVVDVKGGNLCVKTLGDNGGVGLAGQESVKIEGGECCLTCYDDPVKGGSAVEVSGGTIFCSSLTNDGMDSKGSFNISGGTVYAYGPEGAEGAFDNNGKTFALTGGTIVGVAFKSDKPQVSKSTQAYVFLKSGAGVKRYVKLSTEDGQELLSFETPAYAVTTLVLTTPEMEREKTYVLTTSADGETFSELTRLTAQ